MPGSLERFIRFRLNQTALLASAFADLIVIPNRVSVCNPFSKLSFRSRFADELDCYTKPTFGLQSAQRTFSKLLNNSGALTAPGVHSALALIVIPDETAMRNPSQRKTLLVPLKPHSSCTTSVAHSERSPRQTSVFTALLASHAS